MREPGRARKRVRTNNAEREIVGRLESQGYEVHQRGWPDIIAIRGNEVRLIEVKPADNRVGMSPAQRRVAEILKKAGLDVELVRGTGTGRMPRRDLE